MKKTLVILTSNEIEGVKTLFSKIPFNQFDETFVVDWNSQDGTKEFFEEKGVRVIPQKKRGRGEAFRLAAEEAQGEVLLFFSPDGNEDPSDAPKLVKAVEEGYDMVIASRFLPGASDDQSGFLFPYRAWGNRFFTFLVNLFFRGKLTDAINGFRAIKKSKFKELKVDAQGFSIEYQMSIRAIKLKYKIKEIVTQEKERIGGRSKLWAFSIGSKFIKLLWREILIGKNF